MKLLQALAILVLISSCAHNRLQYVKVNQKKIVNVENNTIEEEIASNDSKSSLHSTVTDSDLKANKLKKAEEVDSDQINTPTRLDKVQPEPKDEEPKVSEEAVNEALEAEEDARIAKILSITSVVSLLAGGFFLGIGLFVSIVLAVIARIKYLKSSRSRFNTSIGQNDEEVARKWLLAYWILLAVLVLLVAAIILIFFW